MFRIMGKHLTDRQMRDVIGWHSLIPFSRRETFPNLPFRLRVTERLGWSEVSQMVYQGKGKLYWRELEQRCMDRLQKAALGAEDRSVLEFLESIGGALMEEGPGAEITSFLWKMAYRAARDDIQYFDRDLRPYDTRWKWKDQFLRSGVKPISGPVFLSAFFWVPKYSRMTSPHQLLNETINKGAGLLWDTATSPQAVTAAVKRRRYDRYRTVLVWGPWEQHMEMKDFVRRCPKCLAVIPKGQGPSHCIPWCAELAE